MSDNSRTERKFCKNKDWTSFIECLDTCSNAENLVYKYGNKSRLFHAQFTCEKHRITSKASLIRMISLSKKEKKKLLHTDVAARQPLKRLMHSISAFNTFVCKILAYKTRYKRYCFSKYIVVHDTRRSCSRRLVSAYQLAIRRDAAKVRLRAQDRKEHNESLLRRFASLQRGIFYQMYNRRNSYARRSHAPL